jgi:hypothetical protein
MGPPSEYPKSAARSEPTVSMTARTSSMRVSRFGMSVTRSESPVPRLSKRISRVNEASRARNRAQAGSSQKTSMFETQPGTSTRSRGASPTTW